MSSMKIGTVLITGTKRCRSSFNWFNSYTLFGRHVLQMDNRLNFMYSFCCNCLSIHLDIAILACGSFTCVVSTVRH